MSELVRLYRYKQLLGSRQARSASQLMAALEVSRATLKRDLAKLRDQLNVPIRFDRDRGGYLLDPSPDEVELPGLWLRREDLLALAAGQALVAQIEPGLLAGALAPLQERLSALLAQQGEPVSPLAGRLQVIHPARGRIAPAVLHPVVHATLTQHRLCLVVRGTAGAGREISPQRLVLTPSGWRLLAWCHWQEALEYLSLEQVERAEALAKVAQTVTCDEVNAAVQDAEEGHVSPNRWARVRVLPRGAHALSVPEWHPRQEVRKRPDGSCDVAVPYAEDRDLVGDILRWGPDVQVLEPPDLRRQVQRTLLDSVSRYVDLA